LTGGLRGRVYQTSIFAARDMEAPDLFTNFADHFGLQIETEEVSAAPRDVLASPADGEWLTLVTLHARGSDSPCVRLVFVREPADLRPPTIRDALWWLASDSWAIEHAGRDLSQWAAIYQYPADDSSTRRLFTVHRDRADQLMGTLGQSGYTDLLALYRAEISPG
jgi:hypothetical protein